MEEKDKRNFDTDDEKIHVTKGVFENAREMQQQAQEEAKRKQQELEKKLADRERRAREARDRRLEEERKELIRLKQGLIEESDTIHEEKMVEKKLGFFQKIGNFFYHAKWWLIMAVPVAAILIYMTVSLITKPRPDMIVLVIGQNQALGEESGLDKYVASFADDFNGNGEVLVSVYYIPYSEDYQQNYVNGVDTKLTAELQSADSVIVFGNKNIDKVVTPNDVFVDLTELYPDNEHINDFAFSLADTDFTQKIGLEESQVSDDWFIAIRKPRNLMYSKLDDMQETYDRDYVVFDAIINDLSESHTLTTDDNN